MNVYHIKVPATKMYGAQFYRIRAKNEKDALKRFSENREQAEFLYENTEILDTGVPEIAGRE